MATNPLFFFNFNFFSFISYLRAVAGFEDVLGGVAGVLLPGVVDQPTGFDRLLVQRLEFVNRVFLPVRGSQGLDQEPLPTALKVTTEKWVGM